MLLGSPQVEVGVAEGMDVAGAAKSSSGPRTSNSVLTRVMHQQHRDVELSLQRTKVRQQRGHLAGVVLVDAVQSYKRIQDQQPGPEPPSCLQEPSRSGSRSGRSLYARRSHELLPPRDLDHDAEPFHRHAPVPLATRPRLSRPTPVPAPERCTCPGTACPLVRIARQVSPNHVLAHLGAASDHAYRVGAPKLLHQPTLRDYIAGKLGHDTTTSICSLLIAIITPSLSSWALGRVLLG